MGDLIFFDSDIVSLGAHGRMVKDAQFADFNFRKTFFIYYMQNVDSMPLLCLAGFS